MSKEIEELKEYEIQDYMNKTSLPQTKIIDAYKIFQQSSKEGNMDFDSFKKIIESHFVKNKGTDEFYQLVFRSI
jgi:hypothetical protein